MTTPSVERAVYFLGNDRVLNFGIAAFESLRRTNPDLPAYLLPFNDELTKTRELAVRYNFQIIEDPALKVLHQTAEEFWDEKHRDHAMLKKFFAFFGPAKLFLYADCDVVFLEDLGPLFDKFEQANLQFLSFEPSSDYVYKRGPLREKLERDAITRGFNAGVFIARNGSTTLPDVQEFFSVHKAIRSEFHDTRDQAMLNYFVDYHRWRHQNLAELDPSYSESNNARQRPLRPNPHGPGWLLDQPFSPLNGKRLPMLHWNGLKLPTVLPNMRHFLRFRLAPLNRWQRFTYITQNIWAGRSILWTRFVDSIKFNLHRAMRKLRR